MGKIVSLVWAVAVACAASIPSAMGQTPATAPEVSVRSLKFNYVRVDGQQGTALETEVELDVRGSGATGRNPRFVDNVRVALMLAVQARGRAGAEFQYYYAEAEAVTLEAGTRSMRFYLPPEIVKRDSLSGEPYAFSVELALDGRMLVPQRASVSETLRDRARYDVFVQKVTEARATTDGILVPQHLFMTGLRDGREAPAVIRKAGR
ncbi:MAG TPA: hypothetical protein VMM36_08305 [Opitutaceae bacterium]|nr:hypothetical protein [Opitutaceae bacterium]